MKVVVVGTGYVGLAQGACLAHLGHSVFCVDVLEERVDALNNGEVPIFEAGLPELVKEGRENDQLWFTTDLAHAVNNVPDVIFVCVQTPSQEDGSCDLSYIEKVLTDLGKLIKEKTVVVIKSSVPPATSNIMHEWLNNLKIEIAGNPEFLRQGTAVYDFLNPDRILLGVESDYAFEILSKVHEKINAPIIKMSVDGAQLAKYAANSMLATRLSFINEIAKMADALGADIKVIEEAIGLDPRIGSKFLRSSAGFGGGCLPKDTLALHHTGVALGTNPRMFSAVLGVNEDQHARFVEKVVDRLGDLQGKKLAVWGLSFNGGTDDVRHSPAMIIIDGLLERGAKILAYDPEAMDRARQVLGDDIEFAKSALSVTLEADALLVLTEWSEFSEEDWEQVKNNLKQQIIFDGKNFLPHDELQALGFEIHGMGVCRKPKSPLQ